MYEKLKDIFHNVNDWLKFAEAKHGGLIALNSGVFFGALTIYKDFRETIPVYVILFTFLFIVASIVTSFVSMFPRRERKGRKGKLPKKANFFFSGDLAFFSKEELKGELLKHTGSDHTFDGLEDDLIRQIIANAAVATRKYNLFKIALVLLICGLAIPMLFSVYLLLVIG